jgi:hypothetical protein
VREKYRRFRRTWIVAASGTQSAYVLSRFHAVSADRRHG